MNVKYFNLISTNISTYELSYKQNRHDKNEGTIDMSAAGLSMRTTENSPSMMVYISQLLMTSLPEPFKEVVIEM